jgi:hypothetical protein
VDIGEYAGPHGTTVIVENIFFNVPARKKFMKSRTGEQRAVRQAFLATALARPRFLYVCIRRGKKISLPATGISPNGWHRFTGAPPRRAVPRKYIRHEAGLEGFLSSRVFSRRRAPCRRLYVNRRPVEYRSLGFLLSKAYEGLAPRGQHPAAILFLTIDPSLVDVNIHPAKREVKFFDGRYIDGLILGLAKKALGGRAHPIDTGLFREAVLRRGEDLHGSGDASDGGDISNLNNQKSGNDRLPWNFGNISRQSGQPSLPLETGGDKSFIREVREVYETRYGRRLRRLPLMKSMKHAISA